jgi:hypothetical protein
MKLVTATIALAVLVGYLCGGRLAFLTGRKFRLRGLAALGLAMQVVPTPSGHPEVDLWLLYLSFGPLFAFVIANLRQPGTALILLGVVLNFTVILMNQGMPVSAHALAASGQQDSLQLLIREGGAKHHLAGPGDVFMQLGDVIPLGGFVKQALSPGDVASYLGVAWLIAAGMQPTRRRSQEEPSETSAPRVLRQVDVTP